MPAPMARDRRRQIAARDAAPTFTTERRVRFGHVDPAGIVYYPRYLELIDSALEDWMEAVLGIDRRQLIDETPFGLPTVELNLRFGQPSRLGDRLSISVGVLDVARVSARLSIQVSCRGESRVQAESTLVLIDRAARRARSWPEAWRSKLVAAQPSAEFQT